MVKKVLAILTAISTLAVAGSCGIDVTDSTDDVSNSTEETLTSLETTTMATTIIETDAETEPVTEAPAETLSAESDASSDTMRPEIKESLDTYETFMNQYCDFMASYDATDVAMLTEYAELMSEYATMTENFEALENENLNDAELAYYLEVQNRVTQKLLEVSAQ
ncbi:MAG: DUF6591 domain-containing protein [Ruminococcus sp.]